LPAGAEAGMTDATPGARILVVDDNDDNRYTLTLNRWGNRADTVRCGCESLLAHLVG
jgi:CheY-like chemotaxis protein